MDNKHINCNHKKESWWKSYDDCHCYPAHFKTKYPFQIKSYTDVPGWINDAEFIYEEMVNNAKDGDYFVEIGVLFGQSTTRMAELIKQSNKKIKFDAIDLFWMIPMTIEAYKECGHPYQFVEYYNRFKEFTISPVDICKHPLRDLGLVDFVNFITCDEIYSHRLYDDNSLNFVWIDGDHGDDVVYNHLKNYWPKLKNGAVIGGDDIHYEPVLHDVKKFTKEKNIKASFTNNGFTITKE
jgi:hypothetical protein